MMTTLAALLGAVPLALSYGNGAELRRPLGISIVGGLIVSQVLTLYTTPVLYVYLDRFQSWLKGALAAALVRRRRLGGARMSAQRSGAPGQPIPRAARLGAALATALLAAACAVGPNYHRPAAPVPSAYKELPPGWKVGSPQDAQRRGDWWAIFEDPELDRLEREVNISNQNVKQYEAQYREAVALLREAAGAALSHRDRKLQRPAGRRRRRYGGRLERRRQRRRRQHAHGVHPRGLCSAGSRTSGAPSGARSRAARRACR